MIGSLWNLVDASAAVLKRCQSDFKAIRHLKPQILGLWAFVRSNGNTSSAILKHTLTHWGRVMHICISQLTTIGSDNGVLPIRRQANIWTNAEILLTWTLGTNFIEILIAILTFSLKKMRWEWRLWNGSHFVSASMCSVAIPTEIYYMCVLFCSSYCSSLVDQDPYLLMWINFKSAWISNYLHYKVRDEITDLLKFGDGLII